jgi:hypothetical protein
MISSENKIVIKFQSLENNFFILVVNVVGYILQQENL